MTHIVSAEFPQSHGGWDRMSEGVSLVQPLLRQLRGSKGLQATLVTGGLAAVIVVANQIVNAWADGHLLLAWVAMWAVIFALLALFSDVIRAWPARLRAGIARRWQEYQRAQADARTWAAALSDPRLMAELDCAWRRADARARQRGDTLAHWSPVRQRHHYLLPQPWA